MNGGLTNDSVPKAGPAASGGRDEGANWTVMLAPWRVITHGAKPLIEGFVKLNRWQILGVCIFMICAVAIAVPIELFLLSQNAQVVHLGLPGDQYYQVEFWTPSARTAQDLRDSSGTIPAADQWQVGSDEKLVEFGKLLHGISAMVPGFRYFEVAGFGRTRFKHGAWWVVTVNKRLDFDQIRLAYSEFWHPGPGYKLYMVITGSPGQYVQDALTEAGK